MDVNAYLKRINYHGPIDNTFETLQNLCECHNNTVPFDTLDMYGGERIELELHKVYEKIVDKGRGGLRYEVNGLLHWLLQKLGFLSEIIQAQWFQIDTFLPKFDHMLLLVSLHIFLRYLRIFICISCVYLYIFRLYLYIYVLRVVLFLKRRTFLVKIFPIKAS